jgi:ornithine decarboxylase
MGDATDNRVTECVRTWGTPLYLVQDVSPPVQPSALDQLNPTVLEHPITEQNFIHINDSASAFESTISPPFSSAITEFIARKRHTFACPGHQGGRYLDFHPIGLRFKQLLSKDIFALDVPHAAPELGDVLGHEGPIKRAEDLAAQVFNADETYFVLNGTSTSNKIVTSALLTKGDLVLMDRNNHKSVYLGALIQIGASPVYLDNFRDDCGVLGGYRKGTLDENLLREKAASINKIKGGQERPFRLAIVQHATCDGIVVDAEALLKHIGHICDYVLFDSAWLGYDPFVDLLAHRSPLNIPLFSNSPGIIVTQSVHKQMSGLSQTSQIHKKDGHIRNQRRYCSGSVFNSAFMQHSSTSPLYPLFMSLEVNAAIHSDGSGQRMWSVAVATANGFRDKITQQCKTVQPYYGKTEQIKITGDSTAPLEMYIKEFNPATTIISPIEKALHYLDPCKAIFTTNANEDDVALGHISIPACIVMHYLRENNFTPEKSDFYNFTLLISPSSDASQLARLVTVLVQLEKDIDDGTLVSDALPSLATANISYANTSLRSLCISLNQLYQKLRIELCQSSIFSSTASIRAVLTPYSANQEFIRGNFRSARIAEVANCIAAEGVIPYPPGIMCIVPGECWNEELVEYLMAVQALINLYPELSPHMQGVYQTKNDDGTVDLLVHVLEGITC